ncbi:MAG: NAD(P)H-binding protein [Pseudomonadota bacterium]
MSRHTPLTLAVLGATGRLGRAVAGEARARGHDVIAVTRTGRADSVPASRHRAADAMEVGALVRAVEGADVVFNGLNPPYTRWRRAALPMAHNVMAACAAAGAVHLFPGNVYNFGRVMPPDLGPDTPQRPDTRKGRLRTEMEALFETAARDGRVRTAILRAGDFFGGPVAGSWFDLVLTSKLSKGTFTYPGPMDVPHAWAYLPDLAAAVVDRAERHDALPRFGCETFGGHTATGGEMKAALSRALGRPLAVAHLPWGAIRTMGVVHPMSREIAELRYLWSTPHRLTGAPSRTPFETAVALALASLSLGPAIQSRPTA